MTALAALIAQRIAATGPITLADYMHDCLLHPVHGYYATRDPFGTVGDFTTAPEVSQMFGEVLGLALAQAWLDQGAPQRFALAELGPGRGTLMADLLRATAGVPGFHAAMALHLVEASPHLRQMQAAKLAGYHPVWLDHAANLPDLPLFLIANEFFDALPIRQYQRTRDGWAERLVGISAGGAPHPTPPHEGEGAGRDWLKPGSALPEGREGRSLCLGLGAPANPPELRHRLADTAPGDVVEQCPALPGVVAELAGRIARHGGAALVVDYGGWRSLGDTFQAVRQHRRTDPFAEPGRADLTAHVDFEAIFRATPPARCSTMVTQGALLLSLGLAARAERLAAGLSGPALASHRAAFQRLTDPAEMGNLFKAVALYPEAAAPPAGFLPHDA